MKLVFISVGSPATKSGICWCSSRNSERSIDLASWLPRQKCRPPPPKAMWALGCARQIECVRVVEHLGVAVAGGIHHHDLVARQDLLPVELVFGDRGAPEVQHHRSPAQELFDRRVDAALEVLPQPLALIREIGERLDREASGMAGRVGGCDSEKHHDGADFGVRQASHHRPRPARDWSTSPRRAAPAAPR